MLTETVNLYKDIQRAGAGGSLADRYGKKITPESHGPESVGSVSLPGA